MFLLIILLTISTNTFSQKKETENEKVLKGLNLTIGAEKEKRTEVTWCEDRPATDDRNKGTVKTSPEIQKLEGMRPGDGIAQ